MNLKRKVVIVTPIIIYFRVRYVRFETDAYFFFFSKFYDLLRSITVGQKHNNVGWTISTALPRTSHPGLYYSKDLRRRDISQLRGCYSREIFHTFFTKSIMHTKRILLFMFFIPSFSWFRLIRVCMIRAVSENRCCHTAQLRIICPSPFGHQPRAELSVSKQIGYKLL